MASSDEMVLKCAGALGHQYVVARDYATKAAGAQNPAIYRQTAKGWKRTA